MTAVLLLAAAFTDKEAWQIIDDLHDQHTARERG